jgi:hypothetical protein
MSPRWDAKAKRNAECALRAISVKADNARQDWNLSTKRAVRDTLSHIEGGINYIRKVLDGK